MAAPPCGTPKDKSGERHGRVAPHKYYITSNLRAAND